MTAAALAGVRLAPGAPLVWCGCALSPRPGDLVVIELESGTQVGQVVVAPDQVLDPAKVAATARVLRAATPDERAAWEAARYRPAAGPALAREIAAIPPDAEPGGA